jgi:hypothetical protein
LLFDIYCLPLQAQIYKKMTELILSSLLIIAIGMAFFLVKVLSRRDGEFSSQHIHDSEAMRERGIHCVLDQDREMRTASRTAVKERLD